MENERVTKLETTMEFVKETVGRLERKFDSVLENIEERYIPRNEYIVDKEGFEKRLKEQEVELSQLREKTGKLPAWAASLISLLFSSLIAVISIMLTNNAPHH